jgi:hypothetical protein
MDTKIFRIGGISAIIEVVGAIVALVFAGSLAPNPTTPAEQVLQNVAAAPQTTLVAGWWSVLLNILGILIWLALYFALRESEPTYALLGLVFSLGSSVPTALGGFRLPGMTVRLAQIYATGGPAEKAAALVVMQSVNEWMTTASYVAGSIMIGVAVLLFGLAMLNSRLFPRWLGWMGVVGGGLALLGGLFLPFLQAVAILLLVGALLVFAWILISGISLLRIKPAT